MTRSEPAKLNDVFDVPSPCTGICRIGTLGHCVGCGRDLDEITAWARARSDERLAIRERAAARLQEFPDVEGAA
ncbi:MAG TPA: DUF1289 domain-containing protein [Solimonas sp.]